MSQNLATVDIWRDLPLKRTRSDERPRKLTATPPGRQSN
jgi:hypothetical protein